MEEKNSVALPFVNRLRHRRDFQAVYHAGIRRSGRYSKLRALYLESEAQPARIGISISQKVSKKAVVRNRIKRQIRSACQVLLSEIPAGWKIVIVVRSPAQECKYEHFLRELEKLLVQAEVLDGHKGRKHL